MNFTVEHYGWDQSGTFPTVSGAITASPQGLEISFDVREEELRVTHAHHNEMVCEDSCVEFFCRPYPDDPRYINIEVNPLGTVLLGIGAGRKPERALATKEQIATLGVRTTIDRSSAGPHWTVNYTVTYDLIAGLYGREPMGRTIYANFYKCGDGLPVPHWGSWLPVGTKAPDFHRPEFFGELSL
jgi:hypothetical protein